MREVLPLDGRWVTLRRLSTGDLEDFQAYRHDVELGQYQGWEPQSDDAARAFLGRMAVAPLFTPGQWVQVGIAERANPRLIGDIGLHVAGDARSAEIGFTLARPAQGRGLASEAVTLAIAMLFEQTAVQEIVGITDARNTASIRLLERVGMQRIGEHRAIFRNAPCIEFTYAMARPGASRSVAERG